MSDESPSEECRRNCGDGPSTQPASLPTLPGRDSWSWRLALACALFSVTDGALGLLGWALDLPRLAALVPSFMEIRPNSALGLLLCGVALLLLLPPDASTTRRRLGRVLLLPILVLSAAAIVSVLAGWRVGMDDLLFAIDRFPLHARGWTGFPLRMCLSGAVGLLLAGVSLWFIDHRTRRNHSPSQWLAILAGLTGTMGLLGHAYDVDELHRLAAYTLVTAHTATGLLILAVGTFLARPSMRPAALLWEEGPAGTLSRRVLLPLLLTPPMAGWLWIRLWRGGGIDVPALAAMLAVLMILITALVVGGCITVLSGTDRTRRRAEVALRREEARLRAFLESSEIIAWMKDEAGRIVFLSNNFLKRFGVRVQDWRGKRDTDLWPEDVAAAFRRNDLAVLAAGKPLELIERAADRDGNTTWWLSHKFPFRDEDGKLYIGGLGVDITRRREVEEALLESESRHRKLHETMTDAFVEVDMEGHILATNRAYQAMLGYTPGELHHLTYQDLTPAKWHAIESRIVAEQVLPTGASGIYEKEYRRKDGTVFPVELRTILLRDEDGRPAAMWAIVRDITERKHAQETLQQRETQLRLSLEASNAGTWSWDAQTGQSCWDERYHALYGFPPSDPPSYEAWVASLHPDDRERVLQCIRQLIEPGKEESWDQEFRIVHSTRGTRWMLGLGRIRRDDSGRAVIFEGINLDITARKQREEAERRARRLNDSLIQISESLHATLDFNEVLQRLAAVGTIALGSDTAAISLRQPEGWQITHVHGLPSGLVGSRMSDEEERHAVLALESREVVTVPDAFHDERFNREHLRRHQVRAVAVGPLFAWQKPIGVIFFNYHHAPHTFTPMEVEFVRQVASMAAVAMEHARLFSDLRQSEQALRNTKETLEARVKERTSELEEANRTLRRESAERLRAQEDALQISEHEQQRIGADLHDGLCQQLAGIKYMGAALENRLRERRSKEAKTMAEISAHLDASIEDVRSVARGLHPVKLEANGLAAALAELARNTAALFEVRCELHCPRPVLVDDPNTATHLYRIAQQAVNNALRHGKARHLTIGLVENSRLLRIEVADDGTGFPPGRTPEPGMGLRVMRARSDMIGASLVVEPRSPHGVRVSCSCPLPLPTPP